MKMQKVDLQGTLGFGFAVTLLLIQFLILFPLIRIFFHTPPWLPHYGYLIYYAGIVGLLLAARKVSLNALGFSTRFLGQHLLTGCLAGGLVLACLPLLDAVVAISGLDRHELFREGGQRLGGDSQSVHALKLIGQAFVFPLFEQAFFTGTIFQALLKRLNPVIAVYSAGIIFTLAHFKLNLGLFFLGLISAFLFQKTGTLYASILFHAACSLAGIGLAQFYPRLITLIGFLF